ncbi:phosphoribosylformylglycinamidine synthase [Wolbachia pipientis]|uniref:Phosphoribosylformylglycinamidine synthase subunit PurL n=1 Tax=Wolbachia pipientis TaxID=955 RepID=A0A1E7QJZ9_WOLPI|nr:AIR synthase-related protein [Wolbachia pipientis]OEY86727.1 phosphoribosylformylglycinamidine synthase [Wolbachia pipientis]
MINIRIEVLNNCIQQINVYSIYIGKVLTETIYHEISELFYNKVTHECRYYLYNKSIKEVPYKFIKPHIKCAIEISFLPGMTDNIGNTAGQIVKEYLLSKNYIDKNVPIYGRSSKLILGIPDDIKEMYNPITECCTLIYTENNSYTWQYYGKQLISCNKTHTLNAQPVSINVDDNTLEKISREGINGNGTLGLSLPAMKIIKDYFNKLNRNPYDIELEALAQTWSEHCKHNIFCAAIDEITDGLYEHYIKRATREINSDICVSVFSDNAGAIIFDDKYLIVDKVETHNSPSALDPFGGSITGILGVNRDILGFGKGAEPIMNTYYFCFANELKEKLYRDKEHTSEVLQPEFIMKGIIRGINIGGNCSGIPTQLGSVYFDNRFCAKPLVFVGSVGIIPRNIDGYPSHIKDTKNGDKIVIIGGRVGKDGIHGATFSSEALSDNSPSTIVQIGDPITQKKLSNAILEARNLGLYNAITDNGAGGFSSSIGEMGKEGFRVDLSKVLLKNNNMAPWEIWVSESQERMTLAVPHKNLSILQQIMKKHDVEFSVIGEFNNSKKAIVQTASTVIMDIDTTFLHNGNPKMYLKTKPWLGKPAEIKRRPADIPIDIELKEMLSRHNICSKEFIAAQYDHEVQGSSILKPLQGKGRVCSEAVVSRPILSSTRGIVKSHGFGSSYGEIDTYHMAACAIDTAIRNYVAVGGNINHLALLDNFCWCDSYNQERLWQLKRAAQACYDYAIAFKTPFISGKDSMFNDFKGYNAEGKAVKISSPPSLLISAIGIMENIENAVSLDVKIPDDLIYVLGTTYDELARSEYQLYSGISNNNLPKVDAKSARKLYECYNKAIKEGLIVSAITPNLGGIIVALAKSLIAGNLGAAIDYTLIPSNINDLRTILFSESQSRILVTVAPQNQKKFEEIFNNVVFSNIGIITERKILSIKGILNVEVKDLTNHYLNN